MHHCEISFIKPATCMLSNTQSTRQAEKSTITQRASTVCSAVCSVCVVCSVCSVPVTGADTHATALGEVSQVLLGLSHVLVDLVHALIHTPQLL